MMKYNRKRQRLEGFDYSSPGSYFITICTKNRRKILCHIVGGGAPYDSNFIFYEMV